MMMSDFEARSKQTLQLEAGFPESLFLKGNSCHALRDQHFFGEVPSEGYGKAILAAGLPLLVKLSGDCSLVADPELEAAIKLLSDS